jgi:hypothetical protein
MSQIVKLRRSAVEGKRPTNSQLQLGELSINTTDGKIYFAKSGSLSASIEEVVSTNAQNTGSLNLSGSINLIGNESITGSTKINGSLSVTGNTSLTSLMISGSDSVANVSAFVPSSSVYNSASFNTPNRVASGIRFGWNNEDWTIGAARGLTTDIDGLVFSRNGNRQMLLDENNNLVLSGSINLTGSFNINGTEYTAATSGTSGTSGSSGSSGISGGQNYFLNHSNSSNVGSYHELGQLTTTSGLSTVSVSLTANQQNVLVDNGFMTPIGDPNCLIIPNGLWHLYTYFSKQAQNHNLSAYYTVSKYTTGGTETLLFTSDPTCLLYTSPSPRDES